MPARSIYGNSDDDKKGEPRHTSHELVWMDDAHDAGFPVRQVRYGLHDIPVPVLTRQYRTRIWNEPGARNHGRAFFMRRVE